MTSNKNSDEIAERYVSLIEHFKTIVQTTNSRTISERPDDLFMDNINFFTKSYLVSLCTYLESFLQDVAHDHYQRVCARIGSARIPNNLMLWALLDKRPLDAKQLKFEDLLLAKSKKDISDELSGNPGKTLTLFRHLGVDLASDSEFTDKKSVVGAVVEKRNNIVHHNDDASDITMADLLRYADDFIAYIRIVGRLTPRHE